MNKSVIVELQHITRKRFTSITKFSTELLNFLAQKRDIDEFFRFSLETVMNDLLQVELSAFLVLPQFLTSQKQLRKMSLLFLSEA